MFNLSSVVSNLVRLALALLSFLRLWKCDRQEAHCGDTTPWIAETDNRLLVVKPLPYAHSALAGAAPYVALIATAMQSAPKWAHQTRR